MIIWFAMLLPFIGCAIAYKLWRNKFVWWELTLPTILSFLFILITKFSVESSMLSDTQYKGGMIVEARYYEYWSTWVHKICSEQYACGTYTTGTGNNRTTHTRYCTRYYDCSYCDRNDPYWVVLDDQGHTWRISENEYNRLRIQWKAAPQFVELNRNINYHGTCGQDGNMYSIKWDGGMLTSESSTWESTYENHVQVSKSNFDLRDVSKSEAKKYGLYDYPNVNTYYQTSILGIDSLTFLQPSYKLGAVKMFDYFNGVYGPKRKIRVFVLLFNDKPFDVAIKQKNYWDGGNKNEVVICIDVNKTTGKLNWVYPFTWGENKRISIDLREDIMNLNTLNFTQMYHIVDSATVNFTYRDFKQFNYLSVDPPTWEVWLVYLMTAIITVGMLYYGYQNEFETESETN
jgi:hypothetical protein